MTLQRPALPRRARPHQARARWTLGVSLLLAALPGATARAEAYQDLDSISATARAFVMQRLEARGAAHAQPARVEVGALDPRLQLATCDVPLQAFAATAGALTGNTSVGVRCQGPKPWMLYVPVTVQAYGTALVSARPLTRGAQLTENDIKLTSVDLTLLPADYLTDPHQALGKTLKRPVADGAPLSAGFLEASRVVRRDEQVTILAQADGVEVRMAGRALSDGAAGERVRVRNLLSKRVVEGIVTGPGTIQVQM